MSELEFTKASIFFVLSKPNTVSVPFVDSLNSNLSLLSTKSSALRASSSSTEASSLNSTNKISLVASTW